MKARPRCRDCDGEIVDLCVRCGARLCARHVPPADKRCLLCEWFGFHRRWWYADFIVSMTLQLGVAFGSVWLCRDWMSACLLAIGPSVVLWYARPLCFLDGVKRRRFLAERVESASAGLPHS